MLVFLFILIICEVSFILTVRYFRREFQWLITEKDELPILDPVGLSKFFKHGFDSTLGWVRKPNTAGGEKAKQGRTQFTIDSKGARTNPHAKGQDEVIATFGDSYTFCRQVNDQETWQVFLTKMTGMPVSNYGVGNYGVDQALLRYERTVLPPSVQTVILGFVPETICRIQSYWKHYLEFGNTFAFKPRFVLEENSLKLMPNVMQTPEDFSRLREKLPQLQRNDEFYLAKFRSIQFRFPYLASLFRNPHRNFQLLKSLLIRHLYRVLGKTSPDIENKPFSLIMKFNIQHAHAMYSSDKATQLLKAVLMRFKQMAEERGHRPLVMVMPQLIDLEITSQVKLPYQKFFEDLRSEIDVIDLTEPILANHPRELYSEDVYGGHFSKEGNRLIAKFVFKKFKEFSCSDIEKKVFLKSQNLLDQAVET